MLVLVVGCSLAFSPALSPRFATARSAAPVACVDAPTGSRFSRFLGKFQGQKAEAVATEAVATDAVATATTAAIPVEAAEVSAAPSLIERADALHATNSVFETFDLLVGADRGEDEVAWRARTTT